MIKKEEQVRLISALLSSYSTDIKINSKLTLQNANVFAEWFYARLFNIIYGLELRCLPPNYEGVDLVDDKNHIIAQVTSEQNKSKVQTTLNKEILKEYSGYTLFFILISGSASYLRKQSYNKPDSILFDPKENIYDIDSVVTLIKDQISDDQFDRVYRFVYEQLKKSYTGELVDELTEKDLGKR